MNSFQLDELIVRLKESIPEEPSWTGIGLTRHDWKPVFQLCQEIQAAFKSNVRYPTANERNQAWARFNELRSLAYNTSRKEREALAFRSKEHLDNLWNQSRGISYLPVADILFFFDKTTADQIRTWQRLLGDITTLFNQLKPEMTPEHKRVMSEHIREIRASHKLFWEQYYGAQAQRRDQKQKEWEARQKQREQKQKEWEARQKQREQKQREWEARQKERERKQREFEARKAERERKQREWQARQVERERRQREWEARKAQQQREWEARQREREERKRQWEQRQAEREQRRREWEERQRNRSRGPRRGGGGRGRGGGRGGDCYVTTATCLAVAGSDSCAELQAFRRFRDEWLLLQPGGDKLVALYYATAPRIVRAIENLPNRDEVYHRIWEEDLRPMHALLCNGKFAAVRAGYSRMVERLIRGFVTA
jgi:hypothetical protein